MRMSITKVLNFLFNKFQTVLLLVGLLMVVIATWGLFSFYVALMLAGLIMVSRAFLIDYEKKGG